MFSMNPESAITLVIVENKPLLLTAFSATLATEGVKTLSISSNLSCKKDMRRANSGVAINPI
jgi:hypothetical protein